ncbi:MAG: hypothetical protein ACI8T1_001525 [Verrucomicrobiales bacterium]|jgi:hypothetical protein
MNKYTLKTTFAASTVIAALWALFSCTVALSEGFTDADVLFYGEVQQVSGAQTVLLQTGKLEMTFIDPMDTANAVTLSTQLRPTGVDDSKPFSYALKVPLKYLPDARQKAAYLAIGSQHTDFQLQDISVNGRQALLPDGSRELYALNFASRATQRRLDLIVGGDDTDEDGDLLPDWWERLHDLDPNNPNDSKDDIDADGWSNLDEYQRGSDPTLSNRAPQLTTKELLVPELGVAGVYLQFLDSDTPSAEIELEVTLTGIGSNGFDFKMDGVPTAHAESRRFSLTDLQSGRLTLTHLDRGVDEFLLPVRWSAGGEDVSGQVLVKVVRAAAVDGSEATLWLDGMDLADTGGAIDHWADRSGNDRHAIQPLADYRPLMRDHSIDFAASERAHLFIQEDAVSGGAHTVLAAYRAASSSDHPQTLFSTNRGFLQLSPTTQAIPYPGAPIYQMDGVAVRGYENTNGETITSIFRREADVGQNIVGLSYDGESIAATDIDPVLATLGARRLVTDRTQTVTEGFGGQLHELIVFPTALPEQKLRDVHDYLESKWRRAIIWDLSTELKVITLAATGKSRHIIRGGHGDDSLGGGPQNDILSGGPGRDVLTGGLGADRFVFGEIDTGRDVITDFDFEKDIIDFSAHFWGKTGDARQFVSTRIEGNDSVLLLQRPDGEDQEILLQDIVMSETQLIQLIVEDRLRMGGLHIPTEIQLTLLSEPSLTPTLESLDQPITVEITRSGEGVVAALDVQLGFFEDAHSSDFVTTGASETADRRSVVNFARGETSKTLTLRPIPDLQSEGVETWKFEALPHHKYSIASNGIQQSITDSPIVWLEKLQAIAIAAGEQPARLRVHRDGDLSQNLEIELNLGGTAKEGLHIDEVPSSITIPAGIASSEVQISARSEGLTGGAKTILLQLKSKDLYQLGNPHEVVLYAAATVEDANGAGFDQWLKETTNTASASLTDFIHDSQSLQPYLWSYAAAQASPSTRDDHKIGFRLVDGRPEITVKGITKTADIRWKIEASNGLWAWADDSAAFDESIDSLGLKLKGQRLSANDSNRFYRVSPVLDPGILAITGIAQLTGSSKFGQAGNGGWNTDQSTGDLVSTASEVPVTSRIIAELDGPLSIDFEMEVIAHNGDDTLESIVFYIDGIPQAQTNGEAVSVQATRASSQTRLLMWEFRGSGSSQAVIRKR